MADKRVISTSIWKDEFIGSLSMMQRILWIGMFAGCADDQGRMIDNAIIIRSVVFPYDDIPASDIETAFQFFEGENRIIRYSIGGKKFIQITRWWEHQQGQWAMPSKYPAPPEWNDRIRSYIKGIYNEVNWPKKAERPRRDNTPDAHLDIPPGQSTWKSDMGGHNPDPEINPDPDPKDKEKEEECAAFIKIRKVIETQTGLTGDGASAIKAIDEIEAMGATEQDIIDGIAWVISSGKPIKYYSQIVGPTRTSMQKRIQGNGNGHQSLTAYTDANGNVVMR